MTPHRRQDEDAAVVDEAMRAMAGTPMEGGTLPDPSFIWWKAQLLRRMDAERQAAEPIEVGDRAHIGAAIVAASAVAAGAWTGLSPIGGLPTALVIGLGALVAVSVVATVAWHELRDR